MAAVEERTAEAAGARTRSLFERHGRMVLGLCRVLLRDAVEAEDAAQQAFVSAHRALLGGTQVRDEAAWLAAIARNECRGRIVARMREPLALSYEELVEAAGAAEPEERALPSAEVRQALAELPERQRQAVVLRDVYGLRYREVGAALGLSRPAVESLLFRARRRLKVRLRPVAGALALPLALREGLAQALPGFAAAGGSGATVAGAAGASGLIAKLGAAPIAAKVSAGALAVGAGAGSVAVVENERAGAGRPDRPPVTAVERPVVSDSARIDYAARRHGAAVGEDDANRGHGGRASDDSRGEDDHGSSGPGGGNEREREPEHAGDDSSGRGSGSESSRSGSSDSSSSPGSGSGSSGSGSRERESESSSGPGSGGAISSGASSSGSSGPSVSSGSGSSGPGWVEPEPETSPNSGSSGSGSSGSSGSGSSGSGSEPTVPESSSGSGSSGSGSSGSGSGSEN
jgi:RNA polymerase sigma factor (sigma-70 family)